ncbi:hypothetical protein RUM43_009579 [Polyplax serrata]|uniref:Rab3 GTPase-activating protein catalytic subunit n=1 Tax=Polyplax serrata TaxID=468196 RepID=A0AAN8NQR7_POLSC
MDEETYHYDFTTASELEIFIARVEEILQEWGLHNKMLEECLKAGDFKLKEWCSTSENLNFADEEFKLTRYYLKCDKVNDLDDGEGKSVEDVPSQAVEDMMSIDNDFFCNGNSTENTHPISRWYGLRDFVILVPRYISSVTSESRIKILLSVVSIAGANIKCKVPLFVQTLHPWQSYFLGIHQLGTFHTDFNMIHLKHTPSPCKYLTGLLSMFKSKIGLRMLTSPVTVSVQFTYILKDWTSTSWLQESPDFEYLGGEVLFESEVGSLPFGSSFDSIKELHLRTIWPSLLENSIMDGENYSDLDPLQAPIWRVSIVAIDNPSCLLTDYFSEFLNLSEVKHSLKEILGSIIGGGSNSNLDKVDLEISSSLNALTESKISSFSKAVIGGDRNVKKENMKTNNQSEKPISSENLMVLLYYLFPDADEDTKVPYIENLGGKPSEDSAEGTKSKCLNKTLTGMKSAPYDGLLWRLATAMSHVIHAMGGLRAAAYFWYEFTQELRYRWENGILIQG